MINESLMEAPFVPPLVIIDCDGEDGELNSAPQHKIEKVALPKKDVNFEYQWSIAKLSIEGTEEQRQKTMLKRLSKFYTYGLKIDPNQDFLEPRKEPDYANPNTTPLARQLIIYGVDFIKSRHLKQRFRVKTIVRINDSNWKLVYKEQQQAYAALMANIREQDMIKLQQDQIQLPRGWMEMKPYYESHYERKLFARYATSQERVIQSQKEEANRLKQLARKSMMEAQERELSQRAMLKNPRMKNSEDDDRDRSRDKHRKVFYHCFDPYREENVERDGRDRIKKHLEGSDKSFSMNNMSVMGDKEENNDIEYRPNNKQESVSSNLSFLLDRSQSKFNKEIDLVNDALNNIVMKSQKSQSDINFSINLNDPSVSGKGKEDKQLNLDLSVMDNMSNKSNTSEPNSLQMKNGEQQMNQSNVSIKTSNAGYHFNHRKYCEQTQRQQKKTKIEFVSLLND